MKKLFKKFIQAKKRGDLTNILKTRLIQYFLRSRVIIYKVLYSTNKIRGKGYKIQIATQFLGKGNIYIENATIGVWPSPGFVNNSTYIEARDTHAEIKIEEGTIINNCAQIIADKTKIYIGKHCLIGQNFFVTDSDFHGLKIEDRTNGNYECLPVNIEDNVFIGSNVTILKGVTIGAGAVIANGSIVTKNVPANTLVAGIPSRVIKNLY